MSLILQGSTSGSLTLQEPAVAGTTVLTFPAVTGNVLTDTATQTLTNKTLVSPTFTGTVTIATATVTTLNAPSGVLATQNGMTGIAKAWVQFAVNTGGAVTVNSSFNITSVVRSSQGRFVFTFTTNMPDANYSLSGLASLDPTGGTTLVPIAFAASGYSAPTSSSFGVVFIAPTSSVAYDPVLASITVNGN